MLRLARAGSNKRLIVLHRDRDYLTDEDAKKWEVEVRKLGVEPFLTQGVDVESYLINAAHIHALNPQFEIKEVEEIISAVWIEHRNEQIKAFVNGRTNNERMFGRGAELNHGEIAVEASEYVHEKNVRYKHGKLLLKSIRGKFQQTGKGNIVSMKPTKFIQVDALAEMAKKAFGKIKDKAS